MPTHRDDQAEPGAPFRRFFEAFQEGVCVISPEGKILDVNPAMVRVLGYASREEPRAVSAVNLYARGYRAREISARTGKSGRVAE